MTRLLPTTRNTAAHAGFGHRRAVHTWHTWLVGGCVWGALVWLCEGLTAASVPLDAAALVRAGRPILFFYELAGITAAFAAGLLWAGVSSGRTPSAWLDRVRERWTELELAPIGARRRILARTYALGSVALGCLWLVFHAARDVSLRVANRDNLALAVVGIQVAALLVGVAAFRVAERGISQALGWLGTTRAEQFHRLRWHALVVLALGLGVSALVLAGFWQAFVELFRRYALPAALGVLVAILAAKLLAPELRLRPRARRWVGLGIAALLAQSAVSGAIVRETPGAQAAWTKAPIARLALGWGHFWLDWDRDTHLTGFGGRDCAAFDASKHPGALDVPGNGRDEDCDGVDAEPGNLGTPEAKRASVPRATAGSRRPKRPNLYLITIDAFAVWTLEAYGGARGVAPAIDAFAKNSVVFENFFVQGPSTRLSFPALFTSRFDTKIDQVLAGRFPFELAPSNRMLAEVLADHGYDTLAVIPSPYFSAEHWRGLLQGFESVATRPADDYRSGVPHTANAVTASALQLLERPRHEPVFLWVHYFDAHPPHVLPEGQRARGQTEADSYAAEVTHVDQHVGTLIEHIIEHDPNHVIVVTSDHGMAFDAPRHQHEHYGYDLSTLVLRVPLMVRAPGLTPRRVTPLTDSLDLAPTLTELAGAGSPASFMGHSLVSLLSGEASELPSVRFAQLFLGEEVARGREPLVMVAARTAEHNLVFDRRAGTFSAWRWQEDPEERHDRWPEVLAAASGHQASGPERPTVRSPGGDGELAKLRALKGALDAHVYAVVAPASPHSHRSHNETSPK